MFHFMVMQQLTDFFYKEERHLYESSSSHNARLQKERKILADCIAYALSMASCLALPCQSKLHWRFTIHRRICLGLEAQQTAKLLQGYTLHVLAFSLPEDYFLFY